MAKALKPNSSSNVEAKAMHEWRCQLSATRSTALLQKRRWMRCLNHCLLHRDADLMWWLQKPHVMTNSISGETEAVLMITRLNSANVYECKAGNMQDLMLTVPSGMSFIAAISTILSLVTFVPVDSMSNVTSGRSSCNGPVSLHNSQIGRRSISRWCSSRAT